MYKTSDYILAAILDCEPSKLQILDKIDYDLTDIVYDLSQSEMLLDLAGILKLAFIQGLLDIEDYIDMTQEEVLCSKSEKSEEYRALEKLNPDNDFKGEFSNEGEYSIQIINHKDIYLKYLNEALSRFEKDTGMTITR